MKPSQGVSFAGGTLPNGVAADLLARVGAPGKP
jgi:hypothetical protein